MLTPIWKVYVPQGLFIHPESYLIGHVNQQNQSAFITASSCDTAITNQLPGELQLIGKWFRSEAPSKKPTGKQTIWVTISKTKDTGIACKLVYGHTDVLCTCVIYQPEELLKSALLCQSADNANTSDDTIMSVVTALRQSETYFNEYQINDKMISYCGSPAKTTVSANVMIYLLMVINALHIPFQTLAAAAERKAWTIRSAGSMLVWPSCATQLGNRARKLADVKTKQNTPNQSLRIANVCFTQLLDTMLGLMLMYILMYNDNAQHVANICLAYGDKISEEMKELLEWLMGAPAGLKLNSQLTHFLGKFFQYHIYLWTGYLALIRPVLGSLLYYCSIAGILGLTVQVALFQDIFSTMTVHIYCFYVYAARLYRLQMYALASLWRLFRGKKWNVLRQRVDSAMYDADQLFVGTLLFTVLLFLLPTTGLYYVVFTLLRVVVLSIQGLAYRLRNIINTTPWWSMLKWLALSPHLIDGAVFDVVSSKNNCLVLSMKGTRASLSTVFTLTGSTTDTRVLYSWETIITNLLQGHLIYPWIDKKNS